MPSKDDETQNIEEFSDAIGPAVSFRLRPSEASSFGVEIGLNIRIDIFEPSSGRPSDEASPAGGGRATLTEDGEAGTKEAGRGLDLSSPR